MEHFTDPRDGETYKIVQIGDLVWFAETLGIKEYRITFLIMTLIMYLYTVVFITGRTQ